MSTRIVPDAIPVVEESNTVVFVSESFRMRKDFIWRGVCVKLVDSGGNRAMTNRGTVYLDCYSAKRIDIFCLNGVHARAVHVKANERSMKISVTFNSHWMKLRLRTNLRVDFARLLSKLESICGEIPIDVVGTDQVNARSSIFDSRSWSSETFEDGDDDVQHHAVVGVVHLSINPPHRLRRPMRPGG